MVKIISYFIWYLIYIVSLLPRRFYYILSDLMAWTLGTLFSYRKETILKNLTNSFPDLERPEIEKIAKEYYSYMCDIMVESIWQVSATPRQLCRMVEVEGIELLDTLSEKYGKVMVMMGHRGNWEMVGAFCGEPDRRSDASFANHPITITYKVTRSRISNFLFEKMRMHEYGKFGNPGHIVGSRQILRHVASGKGRHTYMFIADQYPRLGGIPLLFLNQETFFFEGAEFMARRMNMPVVYLDIKRERRGKYRMTFSLISEQPAQTAKGDVTFRFAQLLEKHIMENRYNWLWSHKRWKRGFTEEDRRECREIAARFVKG